MHEIFKPADDNILSGNATLFISKNSGGILYDSEDSRFYENLPHAKETLNRLGNKIITRDVSGLPLKVMVSINYKNLYEPYRKANMLILLAAGLCGTKRASDSKTSTPALRSITGRNTALAWKAHRGGALPSRPGCPL